MLQMKEQEDSAEEKKQQQQNIMKETGNFPHRTFLKFFFY